MYGILELLYVNIRQWKFYMLMLHWHILNIFFLFTQKKHVFQTGTFFSTSQSMYFRYKK